MEYIKEININEAIIHVLDNNADAPVLNEYNLDLDEAKYTLLLKLIQKSLKDEKLRYADFKNRSEEIFDVKYYSNQYLNGECNLLEASKVMATSLFNIMRSKGSIPSCDFITVSFSTEFGPMLGLFKMDYIENYTHSIQMIDNKMSVDIVPQVTCLSSGGQKVHKCAFIKPYRGENNFDLMIIDSQGKDKNENGSQFFTDDLLKCAVVENERDMTKNFMVATEKWVQNNFREDAEKQERFRNLIKSQLEEYETIDTEKLAETISEDSEDSESFNVNMEKYDVAKTVFVDKEYIEKKLRRTRIKIDRDIDIYINKDAYEDNSRFEVQRNGDGTINMLIKHISNYIEK